jgi:hypothetical protein
MVKFLTLGLEKTMYTKIFWNLLPFEQQCCNISLQLQHDVAVDEFCPAANLSFEILLPISTADVRYAARNLLQNPFHAIYFIKVLQMDTLSS